MPYELEIVIYLLKHGYTKSFAEAVRMMERGFFCNSDFIVQEDTGNIGEFINAY